MKRFTHIPTDSYEKQSYKKRYVQRKLAEEDAEREIKEYKHDEIGPLRESRFYPQMQETPPVDEKRRL